jgi:hypothetical protein
MGEGMNLICAGDLIELNPFEARRANVKLPNTETEESFAR